MRLRVKRLELVLQQPYCMQEAWSRLCCCLSSVLSRARVVWCLGCSWEQPEPWGSVACPGAVPGSRWLGMCQVWSSLEQRSPLGVALWKLTVPRKYCFGGWLYCRIPEVLCWLPASCRGLALVAGSLPQLGALSFHRGLALNLPWWVLIYRVHSSYLYWELDRFPQHSQSEGWCVCPMPLFQEGVTELCASRVFLQQSESGMAQEKTRVWAPKLSSRQHKTRLVVKAV